MSYLIPSWGISLEKKENFRYLMSGAMLRRARDLGIASQQDELVNMGLFSKDLGLPKWIVPEHKEGEWVDWVSCRVEPQQIIGVYGLSIIFPFTPGITIIKFSYGLSAAVTLAVFPLSSLYSIGPIAKVLEEDIVLSIIGQATNPELKLDWLQEWPKMEGYFSEPVVYSPGDLCTIRLWSDSPDRAGLVLNGFVAKPLEEII